MHTQDYMAFQAEDIPYHRSNRDRIVDRSEDADDRPDAPRARRGLWMNPYTRLQRLMDSVRTAVDCVQFVLMRTSNSALSEMDSALDQASIIPRPQRSGPDTKIRRHRPP